MATMGLSASMVHDITVLMGNAKTRTQLKRLISRLDKDNERAKKEARLKFEAKFKADMKEALQELKDEKEGKATFMTMDELYSELEKDD